MLSSLAAGLRVRPRRSIRKFRLPELLEARVLPAATGIQALHRSGQTFLTWTEDAGVTGEGYHVYRSGSPITTATLGQAQKLTSRWGPLDDNTSVHQTRAPQTPVPETFLIQDLGTPLGKDTGLFVWTTQNTEAGAAYYAVTQVTNGVENLTLTPGVNSLTAAVTEDVAVPAPVLTVSINGGKGRIYTQYMDYARWNPTFQGYAYNYSVALPVNYSPGVSWPVKLMPHAYGERFRVEPAAEFDWPVIEVFPDDPGGISSGAQTWWYGFAADHNYRTNGAVPTTGRIENFTEQRLLKAVDEVLANFSADPFRVHSQGHSMGASGSLSLGIRYGNVVSGIFASEPMTNYAGSPTFQSDFEVLWGTQSANLPIVSRGPHAAHLQPYDGTGVYDWMNHQTQLVNHRGAGTAFLMVGHGKADTVIDWATQGRPFIGSLNAASAGFTAEQRFAWDHTWMSFDFALDSMFSPSRGGLSEWAYPRNVSFPGIANATDSGPNLPGTSGTQFYNLRIEWSVPWNAFHSDIVDLADRYEISLRSTSGASQTAEITPRRLQAFQTPPGTIVSWENRNNITGALIQSGTVTADAAGLVTIPRVQIGTGTGNRLKLTVPAGRPVVTSPVGPTTSQMPQIQWSGVAGSASWDVWITNRSTGQNPAMLVNVASLNYTPSVPLGIGSWRVWVRSRTVGGQTSAWSAPVDFQITTPPSLDPLPSPVYSGTPLITWNALPGAVKYDLWINNRTTGQSKIVREDNLTATSFQVTTNLGLSEYVAWVRGIDAAGGYSDWSASLSFTTAARVAATSPSAPGFNALPLFQWIPLPGAATYRVFVASRLTGATVIDQSGIPASSWTPAAALPIGDYRWWVRGISSSGIAGAWSSVLDFNVGGRPSILTPAGTTADRTPTFSWTPVTGAARYELWVSRLDGGGVVINLVSLTGTTYTPATNMTPRTYRSWVRAVSTAGNFSEWSPAADVTVTATEDSGPARIACVLETPAGNSRRFVGRAASQAQRRQAPSGQPRQIPDQT